MALTKVRQEQGVVINEGSTDVDFRIESNGNANMIFVDGGSDHVNIGTSSDFGDTLNVSGSAHCSNSLTLSRQSADTGSSGLIFEKTRNTSVNGNTVVANNDQLGFIAFRGNDGDQFLDGAYILGFVDATPGDGDMPTRMSFHTTADGASSPTERMRIASSGNVGIGNTSPDHALVVRRTDGDSKVLELSTGDSTATMNFSRDGNPTAFIKMLEDGSTGTGALIFGTGSSASPAERFRIANNGDLTGTDTSISSNSDERLKKDIEDYSYSMDIFKQYKPKSFNWKNPEPHGNKVNQKGFLAQDIKKLDEQWVGEIDLNRDSLDCDLITENSDGKRKVLTSKFGEKDAMYISIIQQLESRIEKLENK
tara:strand:+ start:134 stop:1231 length:1098 start_codon:yes stop_codon:yes gene_type:complete